MTTDYKKPRRINPVSVFFFLVIAAAVYVAYKFVPVYWQARQVDQVLDEVKLPASRFYRMNDELKAPEADKMIAQAYARLTEMGITDHPDQPLQIWFDPDYGALHARYRVDVVHPVVNKVTVMTMERNRPVPKQ